MAMPAARLADQPPSATYTSILNSVIRDHGLKPGPKLLLITIASHSWKGDRVRMTVADLANQTASSARSVRYWTRHLVSAGWLSVEANPGRENTYQILRPHHPNQRGLQSLPGGQPEGCKVGRQGGRVERHQQPTDGATTPTVEGGITQEQQVTNRRKDDQVRPGTVTSSLVLRWRDDPTVRAANLAARTGRHYRR